MSSAPRPPTVSPRNRNQWSNWLPFLAPFFHWEVFRAFTRRQIELRHKGSILGSLWIVLHPLALLSIYVFVFGFVFNGTFGVLENETRWDYALGLYLGLTIFHFMAESLNAAPAAIVGNPNFVKKVVFPLEILPGSLVVAAALPFFVSLAIVVSGIAIVGPGLSWSALWLPVTLLPVFWLAMGMAWLVAALSVFFRDLSQIVGFLTTGLLFASAIFYPFAAVPETVQPLLRLNPLVTIIEESRSVLIWKEPVSWVPLGWVYVGSYFVLLLGYGAFRRLKPAFADVL